MIRIKADLLPMTEFIHYLQDCLTSEAKTSDAIKEYYLARHLQNVLHKCQLVQLKYHMAQSYKVKSVSITDLELLALSAYFNRREVHPYLLPLQQDILEHLRGNFPALVNVLSNNPAWEAEFKKP